MPTCGTGTTGVLSASGTCTCAPGYTTSTLLGSVYTCSPNTPATLAGVVSGLITDFTTQAEHAKHPVTQTNFAARLTQLQQEEKTADLAFREAESAAQASGYKSRHQTLQEFILSFFFTAIIVFTITLMIRSYSATQTWNEALKILGMMTLITGIVWGILLRYA